VTEIARLIIDGQIYEGWTEISVVRSVEQMAAGFDFTVSERWAGRGEPWRIKPGQACRVQLGDDVLITGWVDRYAPSYDANRHTIVVNGRSKTGDLVDCSAVVTGGQFRGYGIEQIARALLAPFVIALVVETDLGEPFDDVQIEPGESVFEVLDKLARQRAVLLTDRGDGALVITTPGASRASGALVQGENILSAAGEIDFSRRHSVYLGRSQKPGDDWSFGDDAAQVAAEVTDPAITRYRPLVVLGETAADAETLRERVRWQALRRAGDGTRMTITVQGWRQPDGRLWTAGQMVPVRSSWLAVNDDLCIVAVEFRLSDSGTTTRMTVTPVEALTPRPVKKKSGGSLWRDVQAIG
jgi:prophage tail gpP-like protein